MKIIITGGAGFLGQRLARQLLAQPQGAPLSLVLADRVTTDAFAADGRVQSVVCDIANRAELEALVARDTAVIYHLAAIVSGQAEAEFDLGMKINLEATQTLLEIARRLPTPAKFIFTSSVAVFGGALPAIVTDQTAVHPQSSYGAQKAIGELLVNDYSRKGFIDGRVLRLPTISVRPGKPNRAASSFVSGIIREPLNGEDAVCPVNRDVRLWLSSPAAAVANLAHAHTIPGQSLGTHRTIALPGLSVTVGEMIETLERVAGREVVSRIRFERDETVERIVSSWPGRFDTSTALALGFRGDTDFASIVRSYQQETFPNGTSIHA
jgi:nucleoside-diphosphate-sugar epimerase